MVADTGRYIDNPFNVERSIVVDAWQWMLFPFWRGVSLRLNRPWNMGTPQPGYYFYFFGTLPEPQLVEGSVKMGQPIKHPVFHIATFSEYLSTVADTYNMEWSFNPTDPSWHSPGTYLVGVGGFHPLLPREAISPIYRWQSLPLRSRLGGY